MSLSTLNTSTIWNGSPISGLISVIFSNISSFARLNTSDLFTLSWAKISNSNPRLTIVASKIYGIEDAVLDKVTGLLFKAGDINALAKSIILLLENDKLCNQLGSAGFKRVNKQFTKEILKKAFVEYINLII